MTVRRPGDTYDSVVYTYTFSRTSAPIVRTDAYPAAGAAPVTSWAFHDALGRVFQTQTAAPGGSTPVISGTRYTDRGTTAASVPGFAGTGTPGVAISWYDSALTGSLPSQTVFGYDVLDRVTSAAVVSGGVTKFTTTTAYDGTTTTVTPPASAGTGQPNLAATVTVADLGGRTVSRTQDGVTTSYGYDILGRLTSLTTPGSAKATYGYDWLGRRTSTSDPDAGTSTTDYYPGGQVKHTRDGAGTDLFTAIDVLGRVTGVYAGTSTAGALQAKWVYDGTPLGGSGALKGALTSATAYAGSVAGTPGEAFTQAYGYDSRYRVVRTDSTVPASRPGAGTYSTAGTFDGLDRPLTVTYPAAGGLGAETVTAGYSGAFPVTLSSAVGTYVSATGYAADGRIASRTLGVAGAAGSVRRAFTWDSATGRLTGIAAAAPSGASGWNVQNDTYAYTPAGQVTGITDVLAGQRQCYGYDARNRLTAAATVSVSAACSATGTGDGSGPAPYADTYTYADNGNLKSLTHNGTVTSYGYGTSGTFTGGPHAATSVTGGGVAGSYGYDGAGQLTTRVSGGVTTAFTWTPQGQLATVTPGGDATQRTAFTYGPDGTRWLRSSPEETVVYLAGQELHVPRAAGTAATAARYYTIAGATVAVRKTTTSGATVTGSSLAWLLGDAQGSASIAVDAATGAVTRDRYLPYGGNRAATYTLPTQRGWLAQTRDPSTGLIYLSSRYYDPALAHFISTDPLNNTATPQAANPYTYANDNPVSFSDPTGLYAVWDPSGGGYTCYDGCSSAAPWEGSYSGSASPAPSYGGSPRYDNARPSVWQTGSSGSGAQTAKNVIRGIGDGAWEAGPGLIGNVLGMLGCNSCQETVQGWQDDLDEWGGGQEHASSTHWVFVGTSVLLMFGGGSAIVKGFLKGIAKLGERAAAKAAEKAAAESAANPLDMVPSNASRRVLKPDPNGGAQEGVEFKWINDEGQTVRLRAHGPDGTAPPGANAASGPTYRIQVGGRYMDAEGNLYPRGVHNPNSPNYDPAAANATHIPWPAGIPLPW